jgi:hypothetical protein
VHLSPYSSGKKDYTKELSSCYYRKTSGEGKKSGIDDANLGTRAILFKGKDALQKQSLMSSFV